MITRLRISTLLFFGIFLFTPSLFSEESDNCYSSTCNFDIDTCYFPHVLLFSEIINQFSSSQICENVIKPKISLRKPKPRNHVTKKRSTKQKNKDFLTFFAAFQKNISKNKTAAFRQYIHPELGFYYVYRPGMGSALKNVKTKDFMSTDLPLYSIESFNGVITKGKIKMEAWPNLGDCASDGFSKNGVFTEPMTKYRRLSYITEWQIKEFDLVVSSQEQKRLKRFEGLNKYRVLWTDMTFTMSFIFDKRWYIGVIDQAMFDCS